MDDLLSLLFGISLVAVGAVGIVLLQRSVRRVETANTADPQHGTLNVFNAAARWFGIALIGAAAFMALMFGIALVLGSIGLAPFPLGVQ